MSFRTAAVALLPLSAAAQEWREPDFLFGRTGHDVAFDPVRQVLVLVGGRSIQGVRSTSGVW